MQVFFLEFPCPLQRGSLEFFTVLESRRSEVGFQPLKKEPVTQVKVWTVRTLEYSFDVSLVEKVLHAFGFMWTGVVPLPQNFVEVDWVGAETSPQVSGMANEPYHELRIHCLLWWKNHLLGVKATSNMTFLSDKERRTT